MNDFYRKLQSLRCQLVWWNKNKLNCLNIDKMAENVPLILCEELILHHSEFWTELRKVAKAIAKQPVLESRLAALVAIQEIHGPNFWSAITIRRRWTLQQSGGHAGRNRISNLNHSGVF